MSNPIGIVILDGWGCRKSEFANAIYEANTPNFDKYFAENPHTTLGASGLDVGLPDGQMGNSEVGHLNIGAGRVVYQNLSKISLDIEKGKFEKKAEFVEAINNVNENNSTLHVMGLLSDGGVHSHIEHLKGIVDMAKHANVSDLIIHAFLDGRDTPPKSALTYIKEIESYMTKKGLGKIATVSGRFYAMDRDTRWQRTEKTYRALVNGEGLNADSACEAVENSYKENVVDEFVIPTVINKVEGKIKENDSVIFFNFRPDRARQITRALVDEKFDHFDREYFKTTFITMTEYDNTIKNVKVAYKPEKLANTLGEYLADNDKKQLRIAETEKYAHVTFFFNGGVEEPNPGEDRVLVNSPKVETYDLKPEMSAFEVTDKFEEALDTIDYDFFLLNFANPDMVGHTGDFYATVKAVEAVDECLGRIVDKVIEKNGQLLITADHGNAEKMKDEETDKPFTAHSTSKVPCIYINGEAVSLRNDGKLSDLAPTVLELMNLEVPGEMTGKSIIK